MGSLISPVAGYMGFLLRRAQGGPLVLTEYVLATLGPHGGGRPGPPRDLPLLDQQEAETFIGSWVEKQADP